MPTSARAARRGSRPRRTPATPSPTPTSSSRRWSRMSEVKRAVFAAIDAHAPGHALIASNTSHLDVFPLIAAGARGDQRDRALVHAALHRRPRRSLRRARHRAGDDRAAQGALRRAGQAAGGDEEVHPRLRRQPHPGGDQPRGVPPARRGLRRRRRTSTTRCATGSRCASRCSAT